MVNTIVILANDSVGLYLFRKELISKLNETNQVTVCAPDTGLVKEIEKLGCVYKDIKLDRRGLNPFKDLKLLFKYRRLLQRYSPSMVITYTIKPNIYGCLVSRMMGIPYAANITGLGTAFQKHGMLRKAVVMMYRIALKKAKKVFFENEENQQIFIDEGIVRKQQVCLLAGAGVNLEHFSLVDYPKENVTLRFLFIGRVMTEKGVLELFSAMKRLKKEGVDCTLDMLGNCEEDYSAMIKKYEAEGWLHYYGYQEDVRPFIAKAHCFVLPSWHEGMANTNLECAAMARPVITSNVHGCLEAVEDGVTGYLCEKQDADNLYEVMKKFTEISYEERKEMGLAGRKRMEEMFDKRNVVAKTIEALM